MSKIALEGNASGTGTFTIASPNSNSNYTLTLPSSTGTVVVTGGAQTIEFAAGSAASPSITFTGDTNTGIFSPGADTIAFSEGGAEVARFDSSGNFMVGTTSPTTFSGFKTFEYVNSGGNAIQLVTGTGVIAQTISSNSNSLVYMGARSNHGLVFTTNDTERMRIDSSGNVVIGHTTASYRFQVRAAKNTTGIFLQQANVDATNDYSEIGFGSAGGTSTVYSAIRNLFTNPSSDSSTALTFSTTNGSTFGERARITSGGSFGIGTSTPGARFQVLNQITITGRNLIGWIGGASGWNTNGYEELGVGYNGIRSIYTGGDNWALAFSTGTSAQFAAGTQSERARIDSNGYFYVNNMAVGGTANLHWSSSNGQFFVTSSSRRFKHDITDYDKGLAEVMQMQPKYFVYNEEPSQKQRVGFIAEDFHDLGMTEFVEYWKDENDQDTPSEIGYSNMVAILVKSIQELKAITDAQATRIEALEAEVAALKGQ